MAMTTPRTKPTYETWIEHLLTYSFFGILALVPFHAFITTWIIDNAPYDELIKTWKELLLVVVGVGTIALFIKRPKLRQKILNRPINQVIIVYGLLHIASAILFKPDADAAVAGLMINLRFLAFFILAQVVLILFGTRESRRLAYKIVLGTATAVALFGLAQITILPNDFLTHFGYGPDTVEPFMTVDLNPNYIRINSTLRGPNPLGAYLIIPLVYFVWRYLKTKKHIYAILLVPFIATMFASYSRSAWLGLVAALITLGVISLKNEYRRQVIIGGTATMLVLGLVVVLGANNSVVKQVIFHENPDVVSSRDSNLEHINALVDGGKDIVSHPLGQGPGTAGPASFHNDSISRLSENYFIQIGQEVGILGLALFLTINVMLALNLYKHRERLWPRLLLASFVGITLVNLLLHGWADETLALTWWGLAGLNYRD